jgi:alpha-galactosidase
VAFQRALRPYRPGRDGVLLSNTWGAGNRDSRICEEFLLKEIEAGAKIGVDVIQIDDGWQHGRTANSRKAANAGRKKVWNGYWQADPDFWREDRERFPGGLKLLVDRASAKGMRFGIWFGPDSSDDAANWKRDAECLLDYHRRLGIDYFKIDSMKVHTPLALERNRKMFDMMLERSAGDMVFDLDCTAEVRPGFFGLIDIGPLFVENRYTLKPVYWPHHTLKNLWDLSHVIDSVRLRFEFNNPDTNHANYRDSPLGHGRYRPDALFATVMAASPLAWMELSDVSESSAEALAGIVAKWKRERDRWYSGVIHPVGGRPDGVSWTGFVSESPKEGYALVFRELNPDSGHEFDLRPIFGEAGFSRPELLAGYGSAEIAAGRLKVTIPEKLDYLWIRFSR